MGSIRPFSVWGLVVNAPEWLDEEMLRSLMANSRASLGSGQSTRPLPSNTGQKLHLPLATQRASRRQIRVVTRLRVFFGLVFAPICANAQEWLQKFFQDRNKMLTHDGSNSNCTRYGVATPGVSCFQDRMYCNNQFRFTIHLSSKNHKQATPHRERTPNPKHRKQSKRPQLFLPGP